jgi:hypothetical protein
MIRSGERCAPPADADAGAAFVLRRHLYVPGLTTIRSLPEPATLGERLAFAEDLGAAIASAGIDRAG